MATHGRNAHPLYPRGVEIDIDTNGDGVADYYVYQAESGGFATTGQSLVVVQRASNGAQVIRYYTDADLNSGSTIYLVRMSDLGITPGTTIGFEAYGYDSYFTGLTSDVIGGMRFTAGNPRFSAAADKMTGSVARGTSMRVPFQSRAVSDQLSSEKGLLLMYRRNAGQESQEVPVKAPAAPLAPS